MANFRREQTGEISDRQESQTTCRSYDTCEVYPENKITIIF
jgi:hypothetical protein